MTFVNHLGEEISLINHGTPARPKKDPSPTEFHKGWRVDGIPPGALEEAELDHPRRAAEIAHWNERCVKDKSLKPRPVGPWDPEKWLRDAKRRPVRGKPYEIESAARECAALAERAGWLRVEVVELKKEKSV